MRVTDKMTQAQVLTNIQKNRSELANLQNQAATMKRVNKPSDDPVAAARILSNRTENKNLEQFDKNINHAKMFLESTESTLQTIGDNLIRAKELAIQAANDTNDSSARRMIGSELEEIYKSLVSASNQRIGERFLFAGHQSLTEPFSQDGQYRGDDGEMKIQSHKGNFVPMNLPGDRVFLGKGLGLDGMIKPRWDTPQTVEELKQYKLEEQARVQENLQTEQDQLETRGPASVGRIQRVGAEDEGNTAQAGGTSVGGTTGVNLFSLVKGLETALKTNDKRGIQDSLEPLDQALNQINLARAEIGGRVNQLDATSDGIQRNIVDNMSTNSILEDADIFQVMTDLSKTDTTLKATLETSSKLLNMSLLDFLR